MSRFLAVARGNRPAFAVDGASEAQRRSSAPAEVQRRPLSSGASKSEAVVDGASPESEALREIATVATGIAQSLDGFERHCRLGEGHHDVAVLSSSLEQIRTTSHVINAGLLGMSSEGASKERKSLSFEVEQATPTYDDPTLFQARELTALTRRFCKELEFSQDIFADRSWKDVVETAPLSEISNTTKKVFEQMAALQAESWAVAALSSMAPADGADPSREADTLPTGIRTGPKKRDGQSDQKDGSAEEPGGAKLHATSASDQPRGSTSSDDDLQEFLAQQNKDGEDISEAEIQRWQTAFKRFKVPDSSDLHTGDVVGLLEYLGHVLVQEDIVQPLIKEITQFDYLDFDEFSSFMVRFIPREQQRFAEVFQEYDEDQSGEISVTELKHMLHDLGFIPLQAMLREALAIADQSGNGELDFEEFQTFMAVYRRFEGFTRDEVREFRKIFDHYSAGGDAPGKLLPAEALGDALVQGFGLHVSEFAEEIEESLKSGQGLQKSAFASGGGSGKPELVTFSEFLIFARKTREASLSKIKVDFGSKFAPKQNEDDGGEKADAAKDSQQQIFETSDLDGDGLLSVPELRELIRGLGYTPLRQNLEEVFSEVDKDESHNLDFDEFFDFMMIFRQREGFSIASVQRMRDIFNQFDGDGSGEISALELAEIFRELGYKATLEEIHVYVLQVDANGSNQLDFREFLRLMRLHREEELKHILTVFNLFKLPDKDVVEGKDVRKALEELGHDRDSVAVDKGKDVDFEQLVQYADIGRNERVKKEKKKAGFSDEKILYFQECFNQFDRDRSGEIDTMELMGILKEFDWQPKSREEQQQLVEKLAKAAVKANQAGVPNTGENGAINFWTFVQLCRILETEHDHAEEERLNRLMVELRFTAKEVEEFRNIFHEKKKSLMAEEGEEDPPGLPVQAIKRLIFMLGIEIKGEKKAMLDERLELLGCTDDSLLDFEGFLKLMRWLMDTGWLAA